MKETTVRLPEEMLNALDAEADEQGMNRSAYIRHILSQREGVEPSTADALDERIAELERAVFERG